MTNTRFDPKQTYLVHKRYAEYKNIRKHTEQGKIDDDINSNSHET